ncbi:hypothetical protein ACIBL3_45105 [Kribbella sp. NPDC050124]|uniref:hypothetical protein n=1 Tax=Kribbella sp. NPDC050124 TaxID=3364114 RepID=UPI0037AA0FF5
MQEPSADPRWLREPGFIAAGMVIGVTACWLTGIGLLVNAIGMPADAGTLDAVVGIYLPLVTPAVIGTGLCAIRHVRLWAASFVVGVTAGWYLGLVLGALVVVSWNVP